MRFQRSLFTIVAASFLAQAQGQENGQENDVWIQVGVNSTNSTTFTPNVVFAKPGQTVWFNFTQGNLSAIESSFAAPCVPVHIADPTINGFDSGFRDISNSSTAADRVMPVPIINGTNFPRPLYFYDFNTCAIGGVGVINPNDTALETIEGLERNAERLNGTASHSSSSVSRSSTAGSEPTNTAGSGSNGVVSHTPAISLSATVLVLVAAGVTFA